MKCFENSENINVGVKHAVGNRNDHRTRYNKHRASFVRDDFFSQPPITTKTIHYMSSQ